MRLHRLVLAASLLLPALAPAVVAAQGTTPSAAPATAPAADERPAVLAVVRGLFDAMRKGDSAAVRALFHPHAQLATTGARNGAPQVTMDSLAAFLRAVGTPRPEALDERLFDEEVRVDGGLASVWTYYELFVGPRFIHCGVDTFTLAKTAAGWRILALADTRRRTGCRTAG